GCGVRARVRRRGRGSAGSSSATLERSSMTNRSRRLQLIGNVFSKTGFAIDPAKLGSDPRITEAMTDAGFTLKVKAGGGIEPGTWLATTCTSPACGLSRAHHPGTKSEQTQ